MTTLRGIDGVGFSRARSYAWSMKIAPVIPMKSQRQDDEDVWQADVLRLPTWVEEEGRPPLRPVIGMALSRRTGKIGSCGPDAVDLDSAARILGAVEALAADVGGWPAAVQVRSETLAPAVREKLGGHGVRVEVVPGLAALDAVAAHMAKNMGREAGVPSLLSVPNVTPGVIASFAAAAAEFFAATPWRILVAEDIIHVEAPRPDPGVRYASVMGSGGSEFGIMMLDSEDGWQAIKRLGPQAYMRDHTVWSVTAFEAVEVPFGELDLWEDLALPTVMDGKFPVAICFGPKRRMRRPTPRMLAFFEGLLRAITASTEEELAAGRWRKTVETAQGPLEFTLALPAVLDTLSEEVDPRRLPPALLQARAHRQIERLLAEKEFASIEEANRFLNLRMAGFDLDAVEPATPQEQAEEMALLAAQEVGRAAIVLARKALALWPDCADAYTTLGEQSGDAEAASGFFEQAVAAGERALGAEAFTEYAGYFWGEHETRPYMRARLALARHLWDVGRKREAVSHYRELLRLNPNDNQGVRELIVPAMINLGDDDGAEEVLAAYPDDGLPSTLYNRALLVFRRHGGTAAARRLLTCALHENPYVPSYLLGEIELPDVLPEIITFGGEDEAVAYVAESKEAWQSTQGALDWLRARRFDAKKPRRKAVRTGEGSVRGGTSKKKPASRGAKPPTKRRSKS